MISGPSLDMQNIEVVPDGPVHAGEMGFIGYYHLCRIGYAQRDGLRHAVLKVAVAASLASSVVSRTSRDFNEAGSPAEQRGRRLSFCYEAAAPCGYGLHRLLTGCGHDC